ncbi:MAG: 4-hydroxy-3-methylbut-2-enyl diphosphate reductase [Ignavibacteriales bacterium]|nr:4-hydroxy-3-methylbut-2-enyl diphosphate reductase [Ignavibacteriales bacterium]
MKVTVDQNSGFCWGVVRTVEIAEEELEKTGRLYSLGDIIHNPVEIERLSHKGLVTITHDQLEQARDAKVLIRAHGEPPETFLLAKRLGIELIDATCPVVTKVQERIRLFYEKDFQIVVFGKKDHAETIGLVGQTNGQAIVIKSVAEIDVIDFRKNTVLFSQTTMDKVTFYAIRDAIKAKMQAVFEVGTFEEVAIDFHAKDTICGQVSGRDKKLREFAKSNDVLVFVSGKKSSNGKVLHAIAAVENPRSYCIEDERELKKEWFEGVNSVGISGATSTPQWLMERVASAIEKF